MASENLDPVRDSVAKLEAGLGIEKGFLESLFDSDDWSFVIKGHAVVEAAVTHLLVSAVKEKRLEPFFSRLELSGTTIGKVAVAKLLDLLPENERRFIRSLSEMRNDLVHDVRNVGFTFRAHIAPMDRDALKSFRKNFDTWSLGESHADLFGTKIDVVDFFRDNPKLAVWYSLMASLAIINSFIELEADKEKWHEDFLKKLGVVEFAKRFTNLDKALAIEGPPDEAAKE
jgi:hypothetical protein